MKDKSKNNKKLIMKELLSNIFFKILCFFFKFINIYKIIKK